MVKTWVCGAYNLSSILNRPPLWRSKHNGTAAVSKTVLRYSEWRFESSLLRRSKEVVLHVAPRWMNEIKPL